MPDSVTDTTQAPAAAPAADTAPVETTTPEPETLDEWVEQNPQTDGPVDLEDDAQPETPATAQPTGEAAVYAALRDQLTQVVASLKGGNQPAQAAQPQVQQAQTQQNAPAGGDDWEPLSTFLTDGDRGLGYTPDEAEGFTKALSGPLSAIEKRIEAKLQRYEVLAAQYETAQQKAAEEGFFKMAAAQPGAAEIYGTADKKNTEAFEMTKLNAAIIQSMAQAKGINLTDEQAIAQAHKVLYFDKINKPSAKGTVPAVAANRTRTLAAQAARGTPKQPSNGQPSTQDEMDRFLSNAKNDPLSRKLGFA